MKNCQLFRKVREFYGILGQRACVGFYKMKNKVANESGQGTTEYAILVGVLVVIAILAIIIFKPKLQELWDAISEGINSL